MIRTLTCCALALSNPLAAPALVAAQTATGSGTTAMPTGPATSDGSAPSGSIPLGDEATPGSQMPANPTPGAPPSADPLPGNPPSGNPADPAPSTPMPGMPDSTSPAPGAPTNPDPGPGTTMPGAPTTAPVPAQPAPQASPPPPPEAMNRSYPPCTAAVTDSCVQTSRHHRPKKHR